jgi:hypothetical protein
MLSLTNGLYRNPENQLYSFNIGRRIVLNGKVVFHSSTTFCSNYAFIGVFRYLTRMICLEVGVVQLVQRRGTGFDSWRGQEILLYFAAFRPPLEPIKLLCYE